MRCLLFTVVVATIVAYVSPAASAWNGTGHMVSAAIGYRQLSEAEKEVFTDLLTNHPDAQKWQDSFPADVPGLDKGMWFFMRASKWPDEIRRKNNPHDHSKWHFIDHPLRAPDFPKDAQPQPPANDNAVFGIEECLNVLGDAHTTEEEKAVHLSWLIHLVGDVHQPLHCATLITQNLPNGDRGGNLLFVQPARAPVNLHAFWDGLLGRSNKPREALQIAILVESRFPQNQLPQLSENSVAQWTMEGRDLAIERVYLRGNLEIDINKVDGAPPVPDGYAKKAKETAEQQITLSGYRLAKLLSAVELP